MPSFLIVDDSTTLRKMIIAALRPLHPMVTEAGSGLEAIEKLALHSYDAVTLDLNMPDMHGLEFLQFVRSQDGMKNIPILVVTTRSDELSRTTLLNAGADKYITKPFQPAELLNAVQELLA